LPIDNVATILGQIVSGELDTDQVQQIIDFLTLGIDITTLIM